jgi:hypothetical protein
MRSTHWLGNMPLSRAAPAITLENTLGPTIYVLYVISLKDQILITKVIAERAIQRSPGMKSILIMYQQAQLTACHAIWMTVLRIITMGNVPPAIHHWHGKVWCSTMRQRVQWIV